MMSLKLSPIIMVIIVCSYAVGQHLDCQDSLSQLIGQEWTSIHDHCIEFVSSRFTTVDQNEPEFNELVQLCACKLINKGINDLELVDKENFWNKLEEDLFSEEDNEKKQPIDNLNEDELEDYFENIIENHEELEEDEEDLQSSGFIDPQRDEQLVDSIQMGLSESLKDSLSKMKNFESFSSVEKKWLKSPATDRYKKSDFKMKTYAPKTFFYLRNSYGLRTEDLLQSVEDGRLIRFGNPGASGSGFFRTHDDRFLIKTERSNEANLFMDILRSYWEYFVSNPMSLLTKFVGQYSYYESHVGKVRLIVMKNLLPSSVKMNYKYDLKGSTYNRRASTKERAKSSPTFKDLDFIDQQAKGFTVEPAIYDSFVANLKKDVQFLKTFKSMDYSLLLGVHKVESENDPAIADKKTVDSLTKTNQFGPIEAVDGNGQKVLLYLGIIDILQKYRLSKRLESHWKTLVRDENVSAKNPSFYAQRFYNFITKKVLRRG